MAEFNGVNRGFYIADNLYFLQSLNSECIDLVCIDPPFAKNETFGVKDGKDPLKPPLTKAEEKRELELFAEWGITTPDQATAHDIAWPATKYNDIWDWEKDVHESWVTYLKREYPAVETLIEATRLIHGEETAAYICYMAIRIAEIRRVLKPTGSLFLHCDHTAGAYLRQLLDAIFGKDNFRNEIVWAYTGPGSPMMKQFNRKHDTIFWYSNSEEWTFNKDDVRIPYKDGKPHTGGFTHKTGRKNNTNMTKDVANSYNNGKVPEDWWTDIAVAVRGKQRTGYPTQKPIALAERIIKATTNEGNIVLDCFAGCAYVPMAAEKLNRRWVACDNQIRGWTVINRQFQKAAQMNMFIPPRGKIPVLGPNQLPKLQHGEPPPKLKKLRGQKPLDENERRYKGQIKSIFSNKEMMERLLEISGYTAWCCGFANRKADGTVVRITNNFHLDHIIPKADKTSTTDNEITNRAPLCPAHNNLKSDNPISLTELREQVALKGELMVDKIGDLQDLGEAAAKVRRIYSQREREVNPINI